MNLQPAVLDAYLASAAAIHIELARLRPLADDHFGCNPEAIGRWPTAARATGPPSDAGTSGKKKGPETIRALIYGGGGRN